MMQRAILNGDITDFDQYWVNMPHLNNIASDITKSIKTNIFFLPYCPLSHYHSFCVLQSLLSFFLGLLMHPLHLLHRRLSIVADDASIGCRIVSCRVAQKSIPVSCRKDLFGWAMYPFTQTKNLLLEHWLPWRVEIAIIF